mgnify:CR=1 FL=1
METSVIAIIDYGAGNLRSVTKALAHLGHAAEVTSAPERVLSARTVILPGVGAAGDAMASLQRLGLIEPIKQVIAEGRPFLGICLGLQVLLTSSEEGGGCRCLSVIPGTVRLLPQGLKVPQMGWNQVRQKMHHPVFDGIPDGADFYFVHSYYADPLDRSLVAGETKYGTAFCSVLVQRNVVAVQFHPEKSGDVGLRFLENFITFSFQ